MGAAQAEAAQMRTAAVVARRREIRTWGAGRSRSSMFGAEESFADRRERRWHKSAGRQRPPQTRCRRGPDGRGRECRLRRRRGTEKGRDGRRQDHLYECFASIHAILCSNRFDAKGRSGDAPSTGARAVGADARRSRRAASVWNDSAAPKPGGGETAHRRRARLRRLRRSAARSSGDTMPSYASNRCSTRALSEANPLRPPV